MRYLTATLAEYAEEKFVLLSGPRQVGKTTLAKAWLKAFDGLYLNWDDASDREVILKRGFLGLAQDLVLDELHKHQRWKSWLKALYDKHAAELRVVVTGSARLEVFQKSGDSLLGRYESLRLHPFSIGELTHGTVPAPPKNWLTIAHTIKPSVWRRLVRRSGFPEPYTRNDDKQQTRWRLRRRELLVRQDLRELSDVQLISLVEHLVLLLPERVGSPLSINALRQEVGVAHHTLSAWLDILERLYYCFRIHPFHQKLNRALKKERKLYLWDWTEIEDEGARLENVVASHLLKSVHAWRDLGFGEYELGFIRTKEREEVDFVILERRRPQVLIEVKRSATGVSPHLLKFAQALGVPAIQLVDSADVDETRKTTRVISAANFLAALV